MLYELSVKIPRCVTALGANLSCILVDADIELHGPGFQLPLAGSTLMAAMKAAIPVHGIAVYWDCFALTLGTAISAAPPMLDIWFRFWRLAVFSWPMWFILTHFSEQDLPYMIPASILSQLFGERLVVGHSMS